MCSSINPIHHSIDPMKSSSFMHPLIPIHFTHPSLPLFLPYSSIHLFIHLTRHRSPSHLPYLSSILPFFHPFIHSIIPTIHLLVFFIDQHSLYLFQVEKVRDLQVELMQSRHLYLSEKQKRAEQLRMTMIKEKVRKARGEEAKV